MRQAWAWTLAAAMVPGLTTVAYTQTGVGGVVGGTPGGQTGSRLAIEAARESQAETAPSTTPPASGVNPPITGAGTAAPMSGVRSDIAETRGVNERAVRPIDDRLFAAAATASSLAEMATSKLAVERAGSEQVRDYARHVIQDHNLAFEQLQAIAAEKHITLPSNLDIQDQALGESMAGLAGPDFDHNYMRFQVLAHIKEVLILQTVARRGQDVRLRAFATEMLPRFQHHEQQARQIAAQLGLLEFQGGERDTGVNRASGLNVAPPTPAANGTPAGAASTNNGGPDTRLNYQGRGGGSATGVNSGGGGSQDSSASGGR